MKFTIYYKIQGKREKDETFKSALARRAVTLEATLAEKSKIGGTVIAVIEAEDSREALNKFHATIKR